MKNEVLAVVGAIKIDAVNTTVQNKHYYDVTSHYVKNELSNVLCGPSNVRICNQTIVLIEGPSVPSAANLRSAIDNALEENYGVSMRSLISLFNIVAHCAAVIAKMAGSSISRNRNILEHRWMLCLVHTLNNALKATFQQCKNHSELHRVCTEFKNVKRIVEDAKRAEWNNYLPPGFKLVHDAETRFGSTFLVVERFLKLSFKARVVMMNQKRDGALNAYGSLERSSNDSESEICFPALQAILEVFEEVYPTTMRLEDSKYPSI